MAQSRPILHTLEGEVCARDEVSDVAVAALHVVDGTADLVTDGEGNLALTVDVILDELEHLLIHLATVAVHELDTVVGIRVVARRDR